MIVSIETSCGLFYLRWALEKDRFGGLKYV